MKHLNPRVTFIHMQRTCSHFCTQHYHVQVKKSFI